MDLATMEIVCPGCERRQVLAPVCIHCGRVIFKTPGSPIRGPTIHQSTRLSHSSSAGLDSSPLPSLRSEDAGLNDIRENKDIPTSTRRQSMESLESWHSAQSAPCDELSRLSQEPAKLEPQACTDSRLERASRPDLARPGEKVAWGDPSNIASLIEAMSFASPSSEADLRLAVEARLAPMRAQRARQRAEAEAKTRAALAKALEKILVNSDSSEVEISRPTAPVQQLIELGSRRMPPTSDDSARPPVPAPMPYIDDPFEERIEEDPAPTIPVPSATGPAPVPPQTGGRSYSAAAQTDAPAAPSSASLEQHLPKCTPENRDVWPFDFYLFESEKEGQSREKRFGNHRCGCGGFHPEEHCFLCRQMLEVWHRKSDGSGFCTICEKKGRNPRGHSDADCIYGEYRDHPSNPRLPTELQKYARPWPMDQRKLPLPAYYYAPRNRSPPLGYPTLKGRFKNGLKCGLLDTRFNLLWSLESAERAASGIKGYLKFDEKKHGPLMRPSKRRAVRRDTFKSDKNGQKQSNSSGLSTRMASPALAVGQNPPMPDLEA